MTMHKVLNLRDNIDCMYQEKKAEEDLPALKMALTHRYNDWKTTFKKVLRKTYYNEQKQYRQHKHQQNKNN